jgi:DNA gyrase subunit A
MLIFHSSLLATKASKSTHGVGVMTLKKQKKLEDASLLEEKKVENVSRYRVKTIPAAGAILKPEDRGEQQLSLLDDKT